MDNRTEFQKIKDAALQLEEGAITISEFLNYTIVQCNLIAPTETMQWLENA